VNTSRKQTHLYFLFLHRVRKLHKLYQNATGTIRK